MVLPVIHQFLKVQVPKFLEELNVPQDVDALKALKPEEIAPLAGVFFAFLLVVLGALYMLPSGGGNKRVNNQIKLSEAKVADIIPIPEAMAKASANDGKVVFCRCWKSKTFPFCDGSHVKHNKETGDNVGPLVLKK